MRAAGPVSPFVYRSTSPLRQMPARWTPTRSMPPEIRFTPMPKILLVEDNEASRDALARRLERRKYEVVVAADGHQAVARARDAQPDLILMDLGMPGMDGWDATAHL